jgi:hypothetical protein
LGKVTIELLGQQYKNWSYIWLRSSCRDSEQIGWNYYNKPQPHKKKKNDNDDNNQYGIKGGHESSVYL